jgi:hypothetical protein
MANTICEALNIKSYDVYNETVQYKPINKWSSIAEQYKTYFLENQKFPLIKDNEKLARWRQQQMR